MSQKLNHTHIHQSPQNRPTDPSNTLIALLPHSIPLHSRTQPNPAKHSLCQYPLPQSLTVDTEDQGSCGIGTNPIGCGAHKGPAVVRGHGGEGVAGSTTETDSPGSPGVSGWGGVAVRGGAVESCHHTGCGGGATVDACDDIARWIWSRQKWQDYESAGTLAEQIMTYEPPPTI